MSNKDHLFRGPAVWTLVAGIAIGAGSMYSIAVDHHGSLAFAGTYPAPAKTASVMSSTSRAELKALDDAYADLAEAASPAVVLIKSESKGSADLMGQSIARGGEGSGIIFRPDGYIVTNDHVVGGFDKVTVVLKDGREFPGKVTRAEDSDIAVVKIDATGLPTLSFADSSKVRAGQFAMAIGAPFGFANSVTIGHVSALNRQNAIPDPETGRERLYPELIQTDASINFGNSGGPLIDSDGEVIGINSSIVSPNGGGIGLGFAITSNQARLIAETLIEKGKVTKAFLGLVPVDMKDIQKSELHVNSGALVESVKSDGPAGMAGIKANDVVVRIGNIPITDQIDLRDSMMKYAPDSKVDVEVVRDNSHKTFSVKLGEPPAAPEVQNVPQEQQQNVPNFNFGPDGQMPDVRQFMKQFGDQMQDQGQDRSSTPKTGHATLGVHIHDMDDTMRTQFHIPSGTNGAVVAAVDPGSVADRLGLKAGDVIQQIGGSAVKNAEDVKNAMANVNWGDSKSIAYSRFGENTTIHNQTTVRFR